MQGHLTWLGPLSVRVPAANAPLQPQRLGQAFHVVHARKAKLEPVGIEVSGCRKKGLLEPQLLSLLQSRRYMSGRPDRPRQADLSEVDPVRGKRNIGN